MPIISFDIYAVGSKLRTKIVNLSTFTALETVDGYGPYDLRSSVNAASTLYGNINIDGTSFIKATVTARGALSGTAVSADSLGSVTIAAYSLFCQSFTNNGGAGFFGPLVSYGGQDISSAIGYLPSLYSRGDANVFVPDFGSRHFGVLTGLTSSGFGEDAVVGSGYIQVPISQGWFSGFHTGGGYTRLPTFFSGGYEGSFFDVLMYSRIVAGTIASPERIIILDFSSDMTVATVYETTVVKTNELLEQLQIEFNATFLGEYALTKLSAGKLNSFFIADLANIPGPFDENTTAWVVNIDTNATTLYDHYGFNSFAVRGNTHVAAATDGIYTLAGDDDAGFDIKSIVDLAVSRFATPQQKRFPSLYLGVTSTKKLLLKVSVDGVEWTYEAENETPTMANQRVLLGRGLVGSHWRFKLLNQDSADFDLESVEFLPLVSSRRVY